MNAAAPHPFPGSRALAGWWRDLAPIHPQQVWISHLLLHRVEALVRVANTVSLDSLQQAVLKAIALEGPHSGLERLHLDPPILTQLLGGLAREGLIRAKERAGAWSLTEAGREALQRGEVARHGAERRAFYFVDNLTLGSPPRFLSLDHPPSVPCSGLVEWHFEARFLEECIRRPADWKRLHGFPPEIEAVLSRGNEEGRRGEEERVSTPPPIPFPPWRGVILDRPEYLPVVLVLTQPSLTPPSPLGGAASRAAPPGGEGRVREGARPSLLGFSFRPENWSLRTEAPLLSLGEGWAEVFPELEEEPSLEVWRQAWLAWCYQRALPANEASACDVRREGPRLVLHAPPRLVERLRAARSDALKNESWLLVGSGRTRTAALIDLVEMSSGMVNA
jgi:hypothetical protein